MSEDDMIEQIGLIDLRQVAQLVGRSAWTVNAWVRDGKFPPPIQAFPGAKKQWRVAAIKAWLEKRQRARYRPPTPRGHLRKREASNA